MVAALACCGRCFVSDEHKIRLLSQVQPRRWDDGTEPHVRREKTEIKARWHARTTEITQIPSLKCESGSVARLWLYLRLNSLRKNQASRSGTRVVGLHGYGDQLFNLDVAVARSRKDCGCGGHRRADTILNSHGNDKSNQRHGDPGDERLSLSVRVCGPQYYLDWRGPIRARAYDPVAWGDGVTTRRKRDDYGRNGDKDGNSVPPMTEAVIGGHKVLLAAQFLPARPWKDMNVPKWDIIQQFFPEETGKK
ncbi:hypothetical protein C8R44DRAFT_860395 [Mycena epipterygia]|nr:hypothetical protein C8R44DRAFT_860395 [Mycena epipterygia]